MALSLRAKDVEADARRLAERHKTSVTGAIRLALKNELAREGQAEDADLADFLARISAIQTRVARYPRTGLGDDEIMGWDENGLPT